MKENLSLGKDSHSHFEVLEYNRENLIYLVEKYCKKGRESSKKRHISYFAEYFSKKNNIEANTIVFETNYIDKDYLEDYAMYHVYSIPGYPKECFRLHFFKKSFSPEEFEGILKKDKNSLKLYEELANKDNDNYLGFIVLRPLPGAIIGRTCIKTYPIEGEKGKRFFPTAQKYQSNLYGIDLQIDSVPFQEQDCAVAACATTALWSAFHVTGRIFQHEIPSPAEITKRASENFPLETRYFPNHGLFAEQMAQAIRCVGLEPFFISVTDYDDLSSAIYGYLTGGIPIILGGTLYDINKYPPKEKGNHAVTITGYSLQSEHLKFIANKDFNLSAFKISKIYIHDDQVGPFARMDLDGLPVNNRGMCSLSLSTQWKDDNNVIGNIRFVPKMLMIPLHHTIRIPLGLILETISYFYLFLKGKIYDSSEHQYSLEFEWEILLTTLQKIRADFLSSNETIKGNYSEKFLTEPFMPKHIWRVIAKKENEPIFELLFNATDLETGNVFLRAIEYDYSIAYLIRNSIDNEDLSIIDNVYARRVLQWFLKTPLEFSFN